MNPSPACRRRFVLVATIATVVLLASHPELRLFAPLVDALGLDVFALLVGAQLWGHARPMLEGMLEPVARHGYACFIFMLGIMGPYVHAKLSTRLARRHRVGGA
jgi:hypothetical protein